MRIATLHQKEAIHTLDNFWFSRAWIIIIIFTEGKSEHAMPVPGPDKLAAGAVVWRVVGLIMHFVSLLHFSTSGVSDPSLSLTCRSVSCTCKQLSGFMFDKSHCYVISNASRVKLFARNAIAITSTLPTNPAIVANIHLVASKRNQEANQAYPTSSPASSMHTWSIRCALSSDMSLHHNSKNSQAFASFDLNS
jgi:hypothetical protein